MVEHNSKKSKTNMMLRSLFFYMKFSDYFFNNWKQIRKRLKMYFLGNYTQERFIKSRESYVDKNRNNFMEFGVILITGWWVMEDICPEFFPKYSVSCSFKLFEMVIIFQQSDSWYQTFMPTYKTVTWFHNKCPRHKWCLDRKEHLKLLNFYCR